MRRTTLAMAAMLATLILGSGVALALVDAGPVDNADSLPTASSCNRQVKDLGTLGGPNSEAIEINDSEWIVGGADTSSRNFHPALWRSGNIRDLGTMNFSDGEALSINERGTIVGTLYNGDPSDENGAPGRARVFVWGGGVLLGLPTLEGDFGNAHGINNQGTIAGHSDLPSGKSHATLYRCALGLNPNAYLQGRSTAGSSSVEPSGSSTFDRQTTRLELIGR